MSQANYIGRIRLTNFFGAQVIDREDEDGVSVRGVFIPLDRNDLKEYGNGCVDAAFYINESTVASVSNWSHYFRLRCSMEFLKRIREYGYKKMPYIGNMKSTNYYSDYKSKKEPQRVKINEYEQP